MRVALDRIPLGRQPGAGELCPVSNVAPSPTAGGGVPCCLPFAPGRVACLCCCQVSKFERPAGMHVLCWRACVVQAACHEPGCARWSWRCTPMCCAVRCDSGVVRDVHACGLLWCLCLASRFAWTTLNASLCLSKTLSSKSIRPSSPSVRAIVASSTAQFQNIQMPTPRAVPNATLP
jgi:hypothetical protein